MDETPTYIDMLTNRTIDIRGAKTIDLQHTGHIKSRFTVVLTIAANGYRLPTYVILRKLKKPPSNLFTNDNIIIATSDSGFMSSELMQDYVNRIIKPYIDANKCLLILDDFSAHKTDFAIQYMTSNNILPFLIPGGYTYCLQPLDVSINKPFKDKLRKLWKEWNDTTSRFTKKGNKSKPTWQETISMVDVATTTINFKTIQNSFRHCGCYFTSNFFKFKNELNRHLREIIESDCENWNQEIQFYDAMHKIPIYDNSHQFLFEKQAESANIQPKSGSSQEYDDDTVDAEYETIDEVITSSIYLAHLAILNCF